MRVSAYYPSGKSRFWVSCAERAGIVQISSDGIETEVGFLVHFPSTLKPLLSPYICGKTHILARVDMKT